MGRGGSNGGWGVTDFAFTGKKGTGKSKNAVRICRDTYFAQGRAVATNLDIFLEPMFGPYSRKTYVRVPDKPSAFDLLAAGHANPDSYDEEKNGALVLDEMATWLNTRTFSDKGRADLLDFLAHARKFGWDCIYIMQNIVQVDKQMRESFVEFVVRHTRFDKVKIPFVGGILSALFGKRAGYFPKFHTAITRIGVNPQDLKTDSAMFAGKEIEACYDTRQVFQADYPHGTFSVLSPWHMKGRFMAAAAPSFWRQMWLSRGGWRLDAIPRPRAIAVTAPDPAYARVRELCWQLPVADRVRIINRFIQFQALQVRGLRDRPGVR